MDRIEILRQSGTLLVADRIHARGGDPDPVRDLDSPRTSVLQDHHIDRRQLLSCVAPVIRLGLRGRFRAQ